MKPSTHVLAFALLVGAFVGCNSRPSAPPLVDGPAYRDEREGFRFFVPEGWKQRARGSVPAGKIEKERMLTEYKSVRGYPAALLVTVADVPESIPLADYLAKNTLTGEDWRLEAPAASFTLNGVPAAKIRYAKGAKQLEMVREVVAFRRGERVYFFKSFYSRVDGKSQKALQTAIETIVW